MNKLEDISFLVTIHYYYYILLFCSYFVLIRKGKFPRLCPAIIAEGARCPGPNWPQAPRPPTLGEGPTDCGPGGLLLPGCRRGGDGGEVHPASRPGPVQGVALARAVEPCRTQTPTCSLASLARGQVSWRVLGRRPGSLSSHSLPGDHHSSESWLNEPHTASP